MLLKLYKSNSNKTKSEDNGLSETEVLNEELGFGLVIQAMEDDDDCHA